ncbi:hypothetical protein E2C01_049686 [Portunus trituberculatus]|uniref:Uncharacterized protein n=1 Tax=Portunus trituberculatus TaxID=210409 RepID=A0A5B7G721_PORTR|nr:hypothetical protein [Portunus trituberculatus]
MSWTPSGEQLRKRRMTSGETRQQATGKTSNRRRGSQPVSQPASQSVGLQHDMRPTFPVPVFEEELPRRQRGVGAALCPATVCHNAGCEDVGRRSGDEGCGGGGRKRILMFLYHALGIPDSSGQTHFRQDFNVCRRRGSLGRGRGRDRA